MMGVPIPPPEQRPRRRPVGPPKKDYRVDSPEPFEAVAVFPDHAPVPNFRPSMFARVGDNRIAKIVAVCTGAISVMGACTAAVVQVSDVISSRTAETTALRAEVKSLRAKVSKLEAKQNSHLKSDDSFRAAMGAAWRRNPQGEVIFRGVDQDSARVLSENMGDKEPPVWRVEQEVIALPRWQ